MVSVNYYAFIKSYLSNRHFSVKQKENASNLHKFPADVLQRSVLLGGPTLYLLFTSDLSQTDVIGIGTFAIDTASLAVVKIPVHASAKLQKCLDSITSWLKT